MITQILMWFFFPNFETYIHNLTTQAIFHYDSKNNIPLLEPMLLNSNIIFYSVGKKSLWISIKARSIRLWATQSFPFNQPSIGPNLRTPKSSKPTRIVAHPIYGTWLLPCLHRHPKRNLHHTSQLQFMLLELKY